MTGSAAIAEALAVLDVPSRASHSWMGHVVALPAPIVRHADEAGVREALIGSIGATLYDCFYTNGSPRPARTIGDGAGRTMSHELAAANEGAGCLEPGWRIVDEDDGAHVVQRGDLRLWVTADEIDEGARIGDTVSLHMPADLPAYSPGYYIVRGDRGFRADGARVLDRFYLDLRPEGAVPFVREVTRRLNDMGLAFSAKVVDDPDGFDRRDAAVLAFERRDRDRAVAAAEMIRAALAEFLDGGAPAMTLSLAPGLSFAEDPGGGVGFGWSRCTLIANGIVTAAERDLAAAEDRLDVVRERFAEAGIDLDVPHLGPPAVRPPDTSGLVEASAR